MLRDILFITRKDLQYMLRGRETLMWVFVMPIIFFYFIGTVTGGFSGSGGGATKTTLALQAGDDAGFLVDQVVHRLEEQDYKIVRPDSAAQFADFRRRLTVPAAFTDSVLAGRQTVLEYVHDVSGLNQDYDGLRAGRAIYTVLADLVVAGELGESPTPEAFARLNTMPRAMQLEVKMAGERPVIPSGYEQTIPGIMVMFILMVMLTSGAVLLVIERNQGLLRRLAYTPIDRLGVVVGKWGGKWALGVVQIIFAMIAGTVIFKMNWGPDLGWVVVVLVVYGALMAALGVLLGSLARTEGQAVAVGVISANGLAALGGCWWPIEITPAWMQKLQLFIPTGWAMDAMHKLISFGAGPDSVLPHVIGMGLGTLVLLLAATRVFRFT